MGERRPAPARVLLGRQSAGLIAGLVGVLLAVVACASAPASHQRGASSSRASVPSSLAESSPPSNSTPSTPSTSSPSTPTSRRSGPTGSPGGPTSAGPPPVPPNALTPEGMWWGVDSTGPITAAALDNVRDWYLGHPTPSVWGRYIVGHFALQAGELEFAAAHHIYVYLLVPDLNCSGCGGGNYCGNDRTAEQARVNALTAVRAAEAAHVPTGTTLFKDIEEVGACHGELTGDYLRSWYTTASHSRFRVGFYGNTYRQYNDFPRAYCATLKAQPVFAGEVVLADNEPEPQLGAPRGTVGPANAPRFAPYEPSCAPATATKIWQYGESTDRGNYTDIDLVRPGTSGLIAPDGTVT